MVLKKYQVPGTVPSGKPPKSEPYRTVPYHAVEKRHKIPAFSYASNIRCPTSNRASGLYSKSGFKGCIFPCSNCASSSPLPMFSFRRENISIQRPSIWSVFSSKGLYEGCSGSSCSLTTKGHICASIPRQLAFVRAEPDKSNRQFATSFGPYCKTGVFNQSDQMSAYSRAVYSVSRSSTKLLKYDSFSHRDQGPKYFKHVNQNKNRQIGHLPHVVKACRYAGRGNARGQVGHAEPKTLPTLADWETSVSQNSEVHLSKGNVRSVAVAKTVTFGYI